MRRSIKCFAAAAAAAAVAAACTLTAYAMTALISFSDPTAGFGEEFSVKVHVSSESGDAIGDANIMLSYDPSAIEFLNGDRADGGAGSIHLGGRSSDGSTDWNYMLNFRALKAGNSQIKVTTAEIYDNNARIAELSHTGSSSVTITGGPETAADAAASLSSLQVSPGVLTPQFSADVYEYSAVVGPEVTRIAVNASAADSANSIAIIGNDSIGEEGGDINVNICAADGTVLGGYVIHVTRGDAETASQGSDALEVEIGGNTYTVADSFDSSLLPAGYTADSAVVNGRTIMAGKGANEGIRLVYLLSESGSGEFWIYDVENDLWGSFIEIGIASRTITSVPYPEGMEIPAGLTEKNLTLNGEPVSGWIGTEDNGQNFCVFYGMNADGEKNFYRYDLSERTIQRYFESLASSDGEAEGGEAEADASETAKLKKYLYAAIGAAAFFFLAFVFALVTGRRGRRDEDDFDEDQAADEADQADGETAEAADGETEEAEVEAEEAEAYAQTEPEAVPDPEEILNRDLTDSEAEEAEGSMEGREENSGFEDVAVKEESEASEEPEEKDKKPSGESDEFEIFEL